MYKHLLRGQRKCPGESFTVNLSPKWIPDVRGPAQICESQTKTGRCSLLFSQILNFLSASTFFSVVKCSIFDLMTVTWSLSTKGSFHQLLNWQTFIKRVQKKLCKDGGGGGGVCLKMPFTFNSSRSVSCWIALNWNIKLYQLIAWSTLRNEILHYLKGHISDTWLSEEHWWGQFDI